MNLANIVIASGKNYGERLTSKPLPETPIQKLAYTSNLSQASLCVSDKWLKWDDILQFYGKRPRARARGMFKNQKLYKATPF